MNRQPFGSAPAGSQNCPINLGIQIDHNERVSSTSERRIMIVSIVTFKLKNPWAQDEAATVFKSTAPLYLGKPGLIRKFYYVTEDGSKAGGIYFGETKEHAVACYNDAWRAMITEKYGTAPEVAYGYSPVSVDNRTKTIETN
jgi:hypothetical protein